MSKTLELPPDLEQFVRQQIADGAYATQDELLVDAVQALREMRTRHQQLRDDVAHAIEQIERGEGKPLNMEAVKQAARQRNVKQA